MLFLFISIMVWLGLCVIDENCMIYLFKRAIFTIGAFYTVSLFSIESFYLIKNVILLKHTIATSPVEPTKPIWILQFLTDNAHCALELFLYCG